MSLGMLRPGAAPFVFLLLLCSFAFGDTTTTFAGVSNSALQQEQNEGANYREVALEEFGSNVKRLVVENLPAKYQGPIKDAVKEIQNELRDKKFDPQEISRSFGNLMNLLEQATARRGAHLVTVLRIRQKKTLQRLLRLLQRSRNEKDKPRLSKYLGTIKKKTEVAREDFDKAFDATRRVLYSSLSDIIALIHALKLQITPNWQKQLEKGGEVVIRRLESAKKVLDNEDLNIHHILSKTTLVVTTNPDSVGISAPAVSSSVSEDDGSENESPLATAQYKVEKNARKAARLAQDLNERHAGGLNFAFIPAGADPAKYAKKLGGEVVDEVDDLDNSIEEGDRRRFRVMEGKNLEWNFDAKDVHSEPTQQPDETEEDDTVPDFVGRLQRAKRGMDRFTKIHERQMSRRLHELVMAGMVSHSQLIRFVNKFEFSNDKKDLSLGKRLRKIVDIRRARRILHERNLFQLNKERQEASFLYNRLLLKSIQSLGIHELAVHLGDRKWGIKYLRNHVVANLVRQQKLSALARIQNLYRLAQEMVVRNQVARSQQNQALARAARAAGISLASLPQLPLLRPGGGLVLSLRKKKVPKPAVSSKKKADSGSDQGDDNNDDADDADDAAFYKETDDDDDDGNDDGNDNGRDSDDSRGNDDDDNNDGGADDDDDNNGDDDDDDDEAADHQDVITQEDLKKVIGFLKKAREDQKGTLKRHSKVMRDLRKKLKADRRAELKKVKATSKKDLAQVFRKFSAKERSRQQAEVKAFEKMIEDFRISVQGQLENIQKVEEKICGVDSFTGRCKPHPKKRKHAAVEKIKKNCDRYHGYGDYLNEFLGKLYKLRVQHQDERANLMEKLSDIQQQTAETQWKARKGIEVDSTPNAATPAAKVQKPTQAPVKHVYEVYGVNYEEDDDNDDNDDQTNPEEADSEDSDNGGDSKNDSDSRDEAEEITSINEIIRLLRGLVYFSVDEEEKERNQMNRILTRHEKVHHIILSMVDRFHDRWEKLFAENGDDEEKLASATDDLVRLFKLARAYARRAKKDELKIIDTVTDRRDELADRITEIEKLYSEWRDYFSEVSGKVSGLLQEVVAKSEKQNQEEAEIMKLMDERRKEEETEESALLNALRDFRKSKDDERESKRSFKLLIFKKSKK